MCRFVKVLIAAAVWWGAAFSAPPVITSVPDTSATEDVPYSFTASATDADNDALTWAVKNGTTLPSWLTFSASGSSSTRDFVTNIVGGPAGVGYDENTGYTYFAVTDASGTIYKADAKGNKSVFGKCELNTNPFPVGNMIISGTTLYVSCYSVSKIYKFDLTDQSGAATPTLLTNNALGPVGMALENGVLYVASYNYNKIQKVDMSTGVVTDFFSVPKPFGLVFDQAGDCYVSQFDSHKVLKRTSAGDTSTVATLTSSTSDIKIGKNGKFYISQRDASDFRIYESDFSTYQSIAVRSWGMTFNNSGTLIFGEYAGTRLLKLETGAVLSGTPTNSNVGKHNVSLSVTDGTTTVNQEFTITVANVNDPPTSASNTVSVAGQRAFAAADFAFSDIDPTSDTLTHVKIATLPSAGTLKYFGTNISVNAVIPKDSLGQLVFIPAVGGSGNPYTTFTFQVKDGTAFSSSYTMTINATNRPTVTTSSALTITSTAAILGGSITSDGLASITERGVVYSVNDSTPEIGENDVLKDTIGTGTGVFSKSIVNLTPNTNYYVRAYATNSIGTSYGNKISFTTDISVPSVVTVTKIDTVHTDSACFIWQPTSTPVIKYELQVASDSNMSTIVFDDSTLTDSSKTVKSLTNEVYYWRVRANNTAGYGEWSAIQVTHVQLPVAVLPTTFGIKNFSMKNQGGILCYALPVASRVTFKIFDAQGKIVDIPLNTMQTAGIHTISGFTKRLSTGRYIMIFKAGNFNVKKGFVVIR